MDYYPFGMLISERSSYFGSKSYRYGFNGQEKDDEVSGDDNSYTFRFRVHDTRIARFLSVDPAAHNYPWNSCYAFAENEVIASIDLEGKERLKVNTYVGESATEVTITRNKGHSSFRRYMTQLAFFVHHPIIAGEIGEYKKGSKNISTIAANFTINIGNAAGLPPDGEGERRGAYRHALWAAMISVNYGQEIAEKATNSHEAIGYGETAYVDFDLEVVQDISAADDVVDFLNNQLGFSIAKKLGDDATNVELAQATLKLAHEEGLWGVVKDANGKISIERVKMSDDEYNKAKKELDKKGEDGMNKPDDNNSDDEN